jgi:hypothetical protein
MIDLMAHAHKERGFRIFGMLLAMLLLLSGCGTMALKPDIGAEVRMAAGKEIRLYYAGPQEAKNMFCIDEIVSVYEKRGDTYVEVGKVQILREIDRNNLAALVVSGSVKDGDEARKAIAACRIRPLMPQSP